MTPTALRTLDRQVAERVMGWRRINDPSHPGCHNCWEKRGNDRVALDSWSPTTDSTAWMQVVERMLQQGYKFDLSHGMFMQAWRATFYKGAHFEMTEAYSTPGEAICRAALAAEPGGS